MVHSCCICKISSEKDSTISFHRFPKNEQQREKWLKSVELEGRKFSSSSKICSKHFPPDSFHIREGGRRDLKPSAMPCTKSHIENIYSDDSIVPEEELLSKPTSSPLVREFSENFTMFLTDNLELFSDHLLKCDNLDIPDLLLNESMEKEIIDTDSINLEASNAIKCHIPILQNPLKTFIPIADVQNDLCSVDLGYVKDNIDESGLEEKQITLEDSSDVSLDMDSMISKISADNNFKWRAYFKQCTVEDFATPEMARRNIQLGKKEIETHQKKIKILQQQNRRLKDRVARLKTLLKQCKKGSSFDIGDALDDDIDL